MSPDAVLSTFFKNFLEYASAPRFLPVVNSAQYNSALNGAATMGPSSNKSAELAEWACWTWAILAAPARYL